MTHEFGAGEFIAALIENRIQSDISIQQAEFDYVELNNRAYQIMKRNPSIRICLDHYSLETFRRQNSKSIMIERTKIIINNISDDWMRCVIRQNLPSENFVKILSQYEAR